MPRWNDLGPTERRKSNGEKEVSKDAVLAWTWDRLLFQHRKDKEEHNNDLDPAPVPTAACYYSQGALQLLWITMTVTWGKGTEQHVGIWIGPLCEHVRCTCVCVAIVSSFVPDSSFRVHSCGTESI
jgi:hypothetical protein